MSTPGGEQIGEAHIDVDMDTTRAMLALREFSRDANGRLHDLRSRFVTEGQEISRSLERSTGSTDRFGVSLKGLSGFLGPLAGGLGKVGLAAGAIGSALPLIASVVTALEQIAPAGAVAATGLLAVGQASAAIKLGMLGVSDTVTAAFDSSELGAKKFQKSLDKLAPSAKEFALTVKGLVPAFTDFQQSIQDKLFFGFSDALTALSTSVLPVLQTNLKATATTLNDMALNAAQAAAQLATDGTLGKAMAGANAGLSNLSTIPAQVVTALGQLAAAGAPAFEQLTAAAAKAATGISDKLSKAFASGGLQDSINTAIDVLSGLGDIAGNVFGILKNVLGAASTGGAGLFQVLTSVTQALQDATATKGFQDAIGALVQTMGVVADTVGPLLGQTIAVLGPVFVALAGPVQTLVQALGDALSPVIDALGPVLTAAAGAVGALVTALSPLLPVVGNLIASLLPVLVPVLNVLAQTFAAMAPVIAQVGATLAAVLAPIIAALPAVIQPLIDNIVAVSSAMLPLISSVLTALGPALVSLAQSVAELAVALAPLLVMVSGLAARILVELTPLLIPLIALVGRLASAFATVLGGAITNVVVPAVTIITSLFSGDFTAAGRAVIGVVGGIGRQFSLVFATVKTAVGIAIGAVVKVLGGLGGQAVTALGDIGTVLYKSGKSLIQGFIDGIKYMLGAAEDAASSVVDAVGKYFPGSPAEKGRFSGRGWTLYSGQATVEAFGQGMRDQMAAAIRSAGTVTGAVQATISAPAPRTSVASMVSNVTTAGRAGAVASAAPNVSVAPPQVAVTVKIGEKTVTDLVQVVVNHSMDAVARQLAQGVRA
jgi:phage-related protein